jgi:hypothetical protein
MKTIKDARRVMELAREREVLIKAAHYALVSADGRGKLWLAVRDREDDRPDDFNIMLEFTECSKETLKQLIRDEQAARLAKINQELIDLGIKPELEETSGVKSQSGHPGNGDDRPWNAKLWCNDASDTPF